MCAGNKERTERGCGYETITEKEREILESRKLEQYRSGYQESEDDNKEADSKMETNQMERKTGSPPPGLKGAYVELIRSDKLIAEKKREQEKLEKDKREQLRKIREKQKEKEKVEKSEETPAKGKTYIKPKTEMPRLATSENNKINSSSESQCTQEESSEAEAGRKGIDIIRTEDRRKYKGKTPSQETYLRTHQKLADLKNDIKKAARLWTEKAKENIHRNLSRNKVEYIPYSVLYESQHETLYKYWMETLTKKYENEIHLLTVKLHALAGIEEKDIVPEPQVGEKENKQKQRKEKPTTKPVQEKQKGGRLLSKRPSLNDIELSDNFQLEMDGNEPKNDPLGEGEPQAQENLQTDPQGSAPPTTEVINQETKDELVKEGRASQPSKMVTNFKIGNTQLPKLDIRNNSDESQDDEKGNTPYSDARTEISPLKEEGEQNLSSNTWNAELAEETTFVPSSDIFQGHTDKEGSVQSHIGNVENEEVIIFPEQQNKQTANLLSASEVEKTVREGGSVLQYEIGNEGKLTLEVSPNTPKTQIKQR
ncbi:hypothetical protein JTB14_012388 [Gonioctena quinquepunctata]|nr:hypothetical protein JTB14_012388 [Gonioctena quinquepunctata]